MISGEMVGGGWGSRAKFVLAQPFKFYLNGIYVLSQRSLSITPSREHCQLSNETFIDRWALTLPDEGVWRALKIGVALTHNVRNCTRSIWYFLRK